MIRESASCPADGNPARDPRPCTHTGRCRAHRSIHPRKLPLLAWAWKRVEVGECGEAAPLTTVVMSLFSYPNPLGGIHRPSWRNVVRRLWRNRSMHMVEGAGRVPNRKARSRSPIQTELRLGSPNHWLGVFRAPRVGGQKLATTPPNQPGEKRTRPCARVGCALGLTSAALVSAPCKHPSSIQSHPATRAPPPPYDDATS